MVYDDAYVIEKLNKVSDKNQVRDISQVINSLNLDNANENNLSVSIDRKQVIEALSELRLKLAECMRMDNVLFLFGNGSSIYAGSKDTHNFVLNDYINNFCDIKDLIEKISKLNGIEEQLNALNVAKFYFHIANEQSTEDQVSELITNVKKNLIDNFVNSVDYQKLSYHDILFRKLRMYGCLERTSVFTTNYDLAFEYALDKNAIEYADGFLGFVNRIFDPRVFNSPGKMSLVKIHGSVNWIEEDGRVKEIQPKFEDGKLKFDGNAPALIYPTSDKLYQTYSAPYSELMRQMLDKMETSKNVIIVLGYKYGDVHINEIMLKALNNPNNVFYFFLYDCESHNKNSFISKIEQVEREMPNINILRGKFLADFRFFVEYILPSIPEQTDQEKAIEMLQKVLNENAN